MSNCPSIPTCFFPTTTLLIDDNQDFLMNFTLQLDPKLTYKVYDSPQKALQYLKDNPLEMRLDQRCFSEASDGSLLRDPSTNFTVNLDLANLHREVYNPKRYDIVTVLVIDYRMPSINGLEFCQQLENSSLKKIILTGQADEKLAVSAFNNGVIDRFIMKNDPNVATNVNQAIEELQKEYFHDISKLVSQTLTVNSPGLLHDQKLAVFFYDFCKKHNIVEFYLTEISGTFALLDANAKVSWLTLKNKQDLQMFVEMAKSDNASEDIVKALSSGKMVPFIDKDPASNQLLTTETDWENDLYPATQLEANETFYYAYIEKPSSISAEDITSYNSYLLQTDVA